MMMLSTMTLLLVAKATAVLVFAIVAGWTARHRPAAVRHLILVAAFAALALLPVATEVLPAISIPLPAMSETVDTPIVSIYSTVGSQETGGQTGVRPWSDPGLTPTPAIAVFALLQAAWLGGVIGCLVPVVLGIWQLRRVRHEGSPWAEAQATANDLARHAGLRRSIEVLLHEAVASPITWGVRRPAIVFPPDARSWSDVDVRRALTHELEHVRRSDWATLCFARVVCAVYWFHPLAWTASRQLLIGAERACDDAVLRDGHALGYADQLVTLAERVSAQTRRPLLAMANRRDLAMRVHALLDARQERGPAGLWTRVVVALGGVVSVASLAPLHAVAGVPGQTSAAVRPRFDVVSIKPTDGDGVMNVRPLPGRLTANATVQVLMQYAYGLSLFQITGGPRWLTYDQFEIDATSSGASSRDDIFLMLQSLLEDRFQLKVHRETRELPVLTLVVNKGDLKLPPPKPESCADSVVDAATEWVGGGRMPFPGERPPAKGRCGSATLTLGPGGAHLTGEIAMSELVRMLSLMSGRTVVDKTAFTAVFDARVNFVPDETTPAMPPPPPDAGITGVSLARALEEQLGLRLQSSKGPVDVIVVDQIQRPTAN